MTSVQNGCNVANHINMTAKEVLLVSIGKQKRLLIWYKQLNG